MTHLVGVGDGVGVGDHGPDVCTDQVNVVGLLKTQVGDHLVKVVGDICFGVAGFGLGRVAGAAQVDGDDGAAGSRQSRHHPPPERPGERPSVHQHNGRPTAAHNGVQPGAADIDEAMSEAIQATAEPSSKAAGVIVSGEAGEVVMSAIRPNRWLWVTRFYHVNGW